MIHLLLFMTGLLLQSGLALQSPNLVWIISDDLGWNDVGFRNPDVKSPNIDQLVRTGILLNHSYVQPVCSPSRTAFMTGIYPHRLGLQQIVILERQAVCVPLDKTFFPQVLKQHGYKTHAVGKWHLGFCNWNCTPTFRGFDSFYGFYNPGEDFYTKEVDGYYDFRFNTTVHTQAKGGYSTEQFASRAEDIIRFHDKDWPLFLYLPLQSVHTPLQVPQKYVDMYADIDYENRRNLSGMVTAMDDAVGRVVAALKDKGIYDNTLIFFTADNGGWTPFGSNNLPLRGGKASLFEGGTRVVAFLHGPLLNQSGVVYDGLIHAVDWFPTLANALGINYEDPKQDGVNQWKAIITGGDSMRSEFVYNMNYDPLPATGAVAIRVGAYKLIEGFPGPYQEHYEIGATEQGYSGPFDSQPVFDWVAQSPYNDTLSARLLFNLKDDPYEEHNLYDQLPKVAKKLHDRLMKYKKRYVPPNFPQPSPLADPENYGGFWSPGWC
ncbi:hypothetical protein BsWGS_25876 [Bradybaena similaris]